MIPRAAVFIDGAYLDNLLMREPGMRPSVDHFDMVRYMVKDTELFRAYWYDCLPGVQAPEDMGRLQHKEKFLSYLRGLPKMEVRLGKLGSVGPRDKVQFVQKGVDVSLAVDLVALSAQRAISEAHILSGDNDFSPAVKYAKDNGVSVKLWYGGRGRPGVDLYEACDEREELRLGEFKAKVA